MLPLLAREDAQVHHRLLLHLRRHAGHRLASRFATFNLIMANLAQLSINTFVRTILSWIQLLALPVSCAFLTNIVCTMQNRAEVIYPTVVALMAYVIARQFATVFSCVLNTLFVCCATRPSTRPSTCQHAAPAFGFDKKSKEGRRRRRGRGQRRARRQVREGRGGGEGGGRGRQRERHRRRMSVHVRGWSLGGRAARASVRAVPVADWTRRHSGPGILA